MAERGFSNVLGLIAETEVRQNRDGGDPKQFPRRERAEPITLKRGVVIAHELWAWTYRVRRFRPDPYSTR